MRREKFTDEERALVNHLSLSQAERIKIISEIKIAKSNEKQSAGIGGLTVILAYIALFNLLADLFDDPSVLDTQSLLNFKFGITILALFVFAFVPLALLIPWFRLRKAVTNFFGSRFKR